MIRFKDRLADGGNSCGYRDLMMNYKLEGSEHVGELQLHLKTIIDIKEAAHRTYALMRSVGWQDDSLEEEDDDDEKVLEQVAERTSSSASRWSTRWSTWGRGRSSTRKASTAVEMTATHVDPTIFERENPLVGAASKADGDVL